MFREGAHVHARERRAIACMYIYHAAAPHEAQEEFIHIYQKCDKAQRWGAES